MSHPKDEDRRDGLIGMLTERVPYSNFHTSRSESGATALPGDNETHSGADWVVCWPKGCTTITYDTYV